MSVDIIRAVFLVLSISIAGILHVLWLRSNLAQRFNFPIDGGRTFRGQRLFGDNKRLRGFMVLPPASAVSFMFISALFQRMPSPIGNALWPLLPVQYATLGFVCGLAFMLAELPNSFLKRQFGISPGQAPAAAMPRWISMIADRFDSVLGVLLIASWMAPVSIATWIWVLIMGPGMHAIFSVVLHALGIKARAL